MAVTISISSITQNSQSVTNNTSNVTVKLIAKWTGGSWNHLGTANGWLQIDGTKYTFSDIIINPNRTTSGSQTLMTKTVNVSHNSNGSKTLAVSASFNTGLDSSGTVTTSASKVLTTIPRKSSLTISDGTLGTSQTLTINKADSSFKHKITYVCGDVSGYAAGSSTGFTTATSVSWTPPITLASQNTTGRSVSIKVYLKTYTSDGTEIGSVTTTISCAIPDIEATRPSCSISVSDPTEYSSIYGAYIKGLSKFKIAVTPTTAYDSAISTYRTKANGDVYTAASFTTGVIKSYGTLTISSTVKDKRGLSGSSSTTVDVMDYVEPIIVKLTVKRCNENGTENDQGEYVRATMTASVTSLNDQNTSKYLLKYKKSTDTVYTEVGLDDYENVFYVENITYTFAAETGSSYDVCLEVTDNFNTTTRATSASTAFTLMHFGADGTSMSIGKVSEKKNLFDIGLPTRFNSPVYGNVMGLNTLPEIPTNSDFNNYMSIGCWATYRNSDAETIANMPVNKAGRLEVSAATGEGIRVSEWSYLRQRFIPYSINYPVYERDISRSDTNVWSYGEWVATGLSKSASANAYHEPTVLWSGGYYMTAAHTITLSDNISSQPNGIVLVFSRFANGAAEDSNFNSFFVSKHSISAHPGVGHQFCMNAVNFSYVCSKYLYINDTSITGNDLNSSTGSNNGVTYNNASYVLRYVIGV